MKINIKELKEIIAEAIKAQVQSNSQKEVSAKELKLLIHHMINEEAHPRGDDEFFKGYTISDVEQALGSEIERMPSPIDHGYTLALSGKVEL